MLKIKRGWKSRWIAALRSGKYKQANNALIVRIEKGKKKRVKGYCCLGVLARIEGAKFVDKNHGPRIGEQLIGDGAYLDPAWCGIDREVQGKLAEMNDGNSHEHEKRKTFKEIATWIKKNVKVKK